MSDNPKQDIGVKKAPLSLVPPALSIAVSAALADGAKKYGAYNYRQAGVKASIYYEAALRHLSAWWDGEEIAADSGVEHLAHAAACLAILLDTQSIGRMVDDRPPAGGAAQLLAKADRSKPALVEAFETFDPAPVIARANALIARFVADGRSIADRHGRTCCDEVPVCSDCPLVGAAAD